MTAGDESQPARVSVAGRPYSPVRVHRGVAYTAGHVPVNRRTGEVLGSTVEEQTAAVLGLIDTALRSEASVGIEATISARVFLTDMSTIDQVDAAFRTVFTTPYPVRTTVEISALGRPEFLVEVDVIAAADA
jgi:Putative translation initiation inhibitor, yjgF family